jgi:hypothetical protein
MMNCLSLSRNGDQYRSSIWRTSATHRGVRYAVARMSLGRRLEIAREIRALGSKLEYLESGESLAERAEASEARTEIDRVYLRCGLAGIEGLQIDELAATADSLFAAGPEDLTREILDAIKAEWGLSETERKN